MRRGWSCPSRRGSVGRRVCSDSRTILANYEETEQGWDILLGGKWVSDVERVCGDWWFLLSELKDRLDEHTPGYEDEVKLAADAVENEDIYLCDPEAFGDSREFCIGMEFRDGKAVGQSVTLTYPKLSDLTPDEIREIDDYTGGRVFDSGVITPMDVALKFGKVVSFGVMDETNGHNPALVKQLNVRWMEDQQMFKDILCALYHRDIEEIRDSDTYNWGDKNIYDICMYMYEHWADEASNYLQHIADDQDLETIIKYVRYDRSEN